jgi:zinc transporter 2
LEKNKNEISLLTKVSIVCILFMVTEIVGGIISGSLAILTDAAHLLSDLVGFAVSIFALTIGARAPTNTLTFGYYRAETVGALTSVILIWALTIWLIYEAIVRVIKPPPVEGGLMLIIACVGLFANLLMMHMLKGSKTQGHGAGGHDDDHGGAKDKDHDDDGDDHDGDDHDAGKKKAQG